MDTWNDALLATAKRMDVKDIEKAQKAARKVLRAKAKATRDPIKAVLKSISDNLKLDIARSNARIADEFAALRESQADGNVLALAIGDHDKREGAQ